MRKFEKYLEEVLSEGKKMNAFKKGLFTTALAANIAGGSLFMNAKYDPSSPYYHKPETEKTDDYPGYDRYLDKYPNMKADLEGDREEIRRLSAEPLKQMNNQYDSFVLKACNVIKSFEKFKDKAYPDVRGVVTIGYGFTKAEIPDLKMGDQMSQAKADFILADLIKNKYIKLIEDNVRVPLTENQKLALISFAFNVGETAFANSTLLEKLNNKDYHGASKQLVRWSFAGNKRHKGLLNRRLAEKDMFINDYNQ